jgi:hypothetical protein
MDEFDDDGRTDPDPSDIDVFSPARPLRAPRPLVFDRREDEERTQFMDRSNPKPPPRVPEAAPSRPSAPPRSARPARVQLDRPPLEEPTVFKPHTTQRPPPPSSRRSAPPPAQEVMSWPAATATPREPAPVQSAPRPAAGRPAARNSQPPPRPQKEEVVIPPPPPAPVLFASPSVPEQPSVIVPQEVKSTVAVVKEKERGFQSETSVVSKAPKRPPVYVLAGGFGLLGTLLAFGAVLGITSVVRSSSAAAGGKVALHPAVVMAAAAPVVALQTAPTADPPAVATPAKPADPATAMVATHQAPVDSDMPAPRPVARPMHVSKPFIRPPAPAPVAAAAPQQQSKAAANDGPKVKTKGSKADIDDAKAAEELARAQLEASLK